MSLELRVVVPKILGYINNNDFNQAIKLAESHGKISSKLVLLRAYIYYRLNNCVKAIELLSKLKQQGGSLTIGLLHLLGQVYYKHGTTTGHFNDAIIQYDEIAQRYPAECKNDPEYIVNALAAYIAGKQYDKANTLLKQYNIDSLLNTEHKTDTSPSPVDTYEVFTNASFIALEEANSIKALQYLEHARELFSNVYNIDYTPHPDVTTTTSNKTSSSSYTLTFEPDTVDVSDQAVIEYQYAYIAYQFYGNNKPYNTIMEQLYNILDDISTNMQFVYHYNKTHDDALSHLANNSINNKASTHSHGNKHENILNDTLHSYTSLYEQHSERFSHLQYTIYKYNLSLIYASLRSKNNMISALNSLSPLNVSSTAVPQTWQPSPTSIIDPEYNQSKIAEAKIDKSILVTLLHISIMIKDRQTEQASKEIETYIESSAKLLIEQQHVPLLVTLLLLQIYIACYSNDYLRGIELLDAFMSNQHVLSLLDIKSNELRLKPAILALYISLYEIGKKWDELNGVINVALEHFKKASTSKKGNNDHQSMITSLLLTSIDIKVKHGDYQGAIDNLYELYQDTISSNKDTAHLYLSRLITIAYDHVPECVDQYIALLPEPTLSPLSNDDNNNIVKHDDVYNSILQSVLSMSDFTKQTNTKQQQKQQSTSSSDSQFTADGKRIYSADKLAIIRKKKQLQRRRKYPKYIRDLGIKTKKQYDKYIASLRNTTSTTPTSSSTTSTTTPATAPISIIKPNFTPDPYRWKPVWERPVDKKGGGRGHKKLNKGPQGSGVSENVISETQNKVAPPPIAVAKNKNPRNKRR